MWLSKTDLKVDATRVRRVNRYLAYMERRLEELHSRGENDKIVII